MATDMPYKHVCMSVHTCLHIISEHVKCVEGYTRGGGCGCSRDEGVDAPVSR